MELKQFAEAVELSQKIYEESWDEEKQIYQIPPDRAADLALKQLNLPSEFILPLYLLNLFAWNGIQNWADTVLGK